MTDTPNRKHFEVFLAMNEDGDFEIGTDAEEAADRLAGNCGGYQCRIVRIGGWMHPPMMAEMVIEVPADSSLEIKTDAA